MTTRPASLCQWHLPQSHALESWSDLRAFDGTASIVQPLIRPLYDTRGAHDVLGLLGGEIGTSAYDLVRQTWHDEAAQADFDDWWRHALHDGVIANTAASPEPAGTPKAVRPRARRIRTGHDPRVGSGCRGLGWTASRTIHGCRNVRGRSARTSGATVSMCHRRMRPASAFATAMSCRLHTGTDRSRARYGYKTDKPTASWRRRWATDGSRAGAIGNGIGFNVYALRSPETPWHLDNVIITPTGHAASDPSTQQQFRLEGEAKELYPILTLAELAKGKQPSDHEFENQPSLLPQPEYDGYAWAMVIDTSTCIGCNACVVACQAENNVPVVGPDGSAGGPRHALAAHRQLRASSRISRPASSRCPACIASRRRANRYARSQPPCMTAKVSTSRSTTAASAPASARPIAPTRCAASTGSAMPTARNMPISDRSSVKASHNPDVTVRARGVMEKCTYCVQRISRARRAAEKEDRPIADGEVVTACQAACPTRAIHFGDRNNKASRVSALRTAPHHYALARPSGHPPADHLSRSLAQSQSCPDGAARMNAASRRTKSSAGPSRRAAATTLSMSW